MGVQQIASNAGSFITHGTNSIMTESSSVLKSLVGSTYKSLESAWTGGFVGLSEENIYEVKDVIEDMVRKVEDCVYDFKYKVDFSEGFKGVVKETAEEYLTGVMEALTSFVSTYRELEKTLEQAALAMEEGDRANKASIEEALAEIREASNRMRVD